MRHIGRDGLEFPAARPRNVVVPTRPAALSYPRLTPRLEYRRERALPLDSKEWKALREKILVRDGFICRKCGCYGNEVDHVDGDDSNNDELNLQTLCKVDHSKKTARENGAFGNRKKRPVPVVA